jgi:hypothetical protein
MATHDLNGRPVDLVVGIPSYNEADNIGFVVEHVAQGLEKYYPDLNTSNINADNASQDGTKDVSLRAESDQGLETPLFGPSGFLYPRDLRVGPHAV